MLAKSPAFTHTADLSRALGIGATTAICSIVDAILLKPIAVGAPSRFASVFTRDQRNQGSLPLLPLNYKNRRDPQPGIPGLMAPYSC
jgi:putative ABC transport system permease protein